MVQAAVLDGLFLDLCSPFDDGGVTPLSRMVSPIVGLMPGRIIH